MNVAVVGQTKVSSHLLVWPHLLPSKEHENRTGTYGASLSTLPIFKHFCGLHSPRRGNLIYFILSDVSLSSSSCAWYLYFA